MSLHINKFREVRRITAPSQPRPALPPRPPFDTATMRRKTKNESEQQRSRAVAAATHPTGSTAEVAVEALPIRANPGMKKRDSFEVRLPNL